MRVRASMTSLETPVDALRWTTVSGSGPELALPQVSAPTLQYFQQKFPLTFCSNHYFISRKFPEKNLALEARPERRNFQVRRFGGIFVFAHILGPCVREAPNYGFCECYSEFSLTIDHFER